MSTPADSIPIPVERLSRELAREKERVRLLEEMVESKTRELYEEKQLLSSTHESLQRVIETLPSAVIVTDGELIITQINSRATQIFGIEPSLFLGKSILGTLKREWFASERYGSDSAIAKEAEAEVQYHHPISGNLMPLALSVRPLFSAQQEFRGMVYMFTDLSARKGLERDLLQAQKLESIGRLAAGIAHELNTPAQYVRDNMLFLGDAFGGFEKIIRALQGLKSAVESNGDLAAAIRHIEEVEKVIDFDYLLEEVPEAICQTIDGAQHVARIVKSMKVFAHPGAPKKSHADLNNLIDSTVTISRNEWKYVAEVETKLEADLPTIMCLAGELSQVFLNLIINAAHSIEDRVKRGEYEKGKITISTHLAGRDIEILVADNGCGVPDNIKHKLFEPFFTTKGVGRGTGQGLSFCYSCVVDKHGGKISFDSQTGVGTTFKVTLPTGH